MVKGSSGSCLKLEMYKSENVHKLIIKLTFLVAFKMQTDPDSDLIIKRFSGRFVLYYVVA
jgi:hypothetical protein